MKVVSASGLGAAVCALECPSAGGLETENFAFGLVTDLHYADMDMRNNRHYRDSLAKFEACVARFNDLEPAFVVELGDFIDGGEKDAEIAHLEKIAGVFGLFGGGRYHVLGNHDMATLSKEEFIALSGALGKWYSFSHGRFHFIVLDGNFNADGSDYNAGNFVWTDTWIHPPQKDWLLGELERFRDGSVIVFIHQNLDDDPADAKNMHRVNNAPEIRRILEGAGNVQAVFQGHKHVGGFSVVNGIPYVTLGAAVEGPGLENNAFALAKSADGTMSMTGFGTQVSYDL